MSVPTTPIVPISPSYVVLSDGRRCKAHYTHYYDDGNIVLLVEDYVFRLFRSVLARRSEVLKDLFASLQPQTSSSPITLDGLSIIVLRDSTTDFAAFLDFVHPPPSPPSWETVPRWRALFGALRVARKYGVDDVEIQALKGLEGVLPTTAETFERSTVYATLSAAVEVVNMSRELEGETTRRFLPLAFYRLATLSAQNVAAASTMGVLCRLSKDDLVRIHVGRAALQEALFSQAGAMLPDMNPRAWRCPSGRRCPSGSGGGGGGKRSWATLVQFPLEELRLRIRSRASSGEYCDDCDELLRDRLKQLQTMIYANIPLYFKLTE
ncbi:hypothetical protein FRB90_008703 [Tulasnella sp. 427]|nr:hypothetical protein FRB90_008703 [Tulasnella sp. 427]